MARQTNQRAISGVQFPELEGFVVGFNDPLQDNEH